MINPTVFYMRNFNVLSLLKIENPVEDLSGSKNLKTK